LFINSIGSESKNGNLQGISTFIETKIEIVKHSFFDCGKDIISIKKSSGKISVTKIRKIGQILKTFELFDQTAPVGFC
jgi:hypothetical protein